MSYVGLSISRFAHTHERNGFVAWFHSLKMKPLFIERTTYETVRDVITSPRKYTEENIESQPALRDVVEACRLLVENRVLCADPARDDAVIQHFREHIAPPHIRIAYFVLAESCNLACSYCFEGVRPTSRSSLMTPEVARKSVAFLERTLSSTTDLGSLSDIIFYGGEPLLNSKALSVVLEEVRKRTAVSPDLWKDTSFSVVTNGTMLTREIIEELHRNDVAISISVDGPREVTDSSRRHRDGTPAFDRIMRGISLCREAGVPFSLSMTLSRAATEAPEQIMHFIEEVQPSSIGFNLLMSDRPVSDPEDFSDEAAQFLIDAFTEFRETGLYEDRMMRKVKAFALSRPHFFDCGASGANQLIFTPSGRVGICHGYLTDKQFFPTHVDDASFDPADDPVFLEWWKRTPINMEACQSCEALGICGGGCPMNAERTHGSIWELDERFCVHAKRTLAWLIWDLHDQTEACKSSQPETR